MLTWDQESAAHNPFASYQIIHRNGAVAPFEPSEIERAMMQAFLAVHATNKFIQAKLQITNNIVQAKLPIFDWAQACSAIQMARRSAPYTLGAWVKQYLLSLFKLKDRAAGLGTTKLSGFFSACKTNLRNAP
jgi:hypothetical protein